jgi:hypothetical protein
LTYGEAEMKEPEFPLNRAEYEGIEIKERERRTNK